MSVIFDGVTLTGAYAGNEAEVAKEFRSGISLFISYTKGDETTMEIKIEFSPQSDTEGAEDWYQETSDSGGTITLFERQFTGTGLYKVDVPGTPKEDKIRISVKGTGGGPTGTVSIDASA